MKLSNIIKKVFTIAFLALWGCFAAINLIEQFPYLRSSYWGNSGLSSTLKSVEAAADGGISYQGAIQEMGGAIRSLLGQRTVNNYSMVRGENGQLLYTDFYPYAISEPDIPAQQIQRLDAAAQAQGASLLYVNCMDQFNVESDSYGDVFARNLNPRADAFLYALQGYGVDHLDSRATLKASQLSPDEYVYKTEPHWTIQACFEVYRGIAQKFGEQGIDIDPDGFYTSKDNYTQTVFQQRYAGKLGRISGISYSGHEDFTLIAPNFETDFTISYPESPGREAKQGDFWSTLLNRQWMEYDDPYENDMYALYLDDLYSLRIIQNNLNTNGAKVLLIGDSYMLPVAAFLSTAVSEIHLVSPYSTIGEGNMIDYMDANGFDYVVIGLSPGTLYTGGFTFLNGIEVV